MTRCICVVERLPDRRSTKDGERRPDLRRSIAASTLLALVALSFPGCGGEGGDGIELVFAAGNDPSGATAALIEEYNAAHPGVTVRFQAMPANTDTQHDAYVTYLSARESNIDLYSLDVIWTAEFAKAGWIAELPEGLLDRNAFLEAPLKSATYEGALYAVPWFTDAGVLYYRRDLLDEEGLPVPETWSDLRAACRRVAEPRGMEGFVWQGARYEGLVCDFLEFLWGLGGTLDPESLADDPGRVERDVSETLAMMRALIEDGTSPESVLTYKEEDARRVFTEGHALFMRNWPYAWSMAQGEGSKVKDAVGTARLAHAPGETPYSTIGGWNVAVSAFTEHPDEAIEFLQFITGERSLKERAIAGGYLPTRKSTFKDPDVLDANPYFADFFEVFRFTRNRPRSPEYPRASDVTQEHVHEAISGQTSPEEAASAMVDALVPILAE
ncbi:MAG: extracellular solute-binding protein [Candidatus Eisenbacteria bacterium]|nr:extracellular solute-binding protein [Candidatus Eisenbacteria bacterium]